MALLNNKGQVGNTIIGILTIFVVVVIFSALAPVLQEIIDNTSAVIGGTAAFVLALVPLAIVVAILASAFNIASPYFEQRQ